MCDALRWHQHPMNLAMLGTSVGISWAIERAHTPSFRTLSPGQLLRTYAPIFFRNWIVMTTLVHHDSTMFAMGSALNVAGTIAYLAIFPPPNDPTVPIFRRCLIFMNANMITYSLILSLLNLLRAPR